jgi:hypothetical protein
MTAISSVPQTHPVTRYGFTGLVFLLTLTGFAQMPIFKRYYIADIPGLGWLAKFFVTHYMHYLGAIAFLALASYLLGEFLLLQRRRFRVTACGYARGGMLAGIAVTGLLLVVRNLPGILFPAGLIILLDVAHLGLVVLFMGTVVVCRVQKKRWTIAC